MAITKMQATTTLAIITACRDWPKLLLPLMVRGLVVDTDGCVGPGPGPGGDGGPWDVV